MINGKKVRKISAHYIFTNTGSPLKKGILEIDAAGKIIRITDTHGKLEESEKLEFFNGILCPGFINAHCHIELSAFHKKIKKGAGIPAFISGIQSLRQTNNNLDEKTIEKTDMLMKKNGIVAVGDISNTNASFQLKKNSALRYHTFIEIFGTKPSEAEKIMKNALELKNLIKQNATLTIHSMYSLSDELQTFFLNYLNQNPGILSIHNQESASELQYFRNGDGPLADFLNISRKADAIHQNKKKNPMVLFLKKIKPSVNILLVHNTFTTEKEIKILHELKKKIFWILCPNSNSYIENQLPDVKMMIKNGCNIALGTDSLASNHTLSVLEEMKTLQHYFPEIPLDELIKWATLNGAKALNMDTSFGKIEPGMNPGINLLTDIDFKNMRITDKTKVKNLSDT